MEEVLQAILAGFIGIVLVILILAKPYLGVVFTLVSLPAVDLLPPIPFLTSVIMIVGAVTLVGFVFHRTNESGKPFFNFKRIHIVGLLFVGWVLVSNFEAAWFGRERNWYLTFFQLWVLVWLASELMNSPKKQHVFMWLFAITSAISAVIAINEGSIGDTISTSIRAIGLAGNPNSTGRYLVVSMVFFSYLSTVTEKRLFRVIAIGGVVITFLGVFFTLSRTSILLLIAALVLQNLLNRSRKFSFLLLLAYVIAALVMWFLSEQIIFILKSIMPSILQGTDTIGLRYKLWQAARDMWLDHILQGVGAGMYPINLRYYAPGLSPHYWAEQAHNTYLMVLAETGLVGFFFFSLLLFFSLKNFWISSKIYDDAVISLRNVWLTVFLVILIGGVTANGHYDKLLWFLLGISVYFQNLLSVGSQEKIPYQYIRHGLTAIKK